MAKLLWDQAGEKTFETGVQQGVLFLRDGTGAYPQGIAWNGLISVSESPEGGEPEAIYANNKKYLELMSAEELGLTIEAYTYPKEFEACDGLSEVATGVQLGQQSRKPFGLAYKTLIGNDVDDTTHGYKLHLVYGGLASPSEKSYETVNDTPEAITFSWDVSTTPIEIDGYKPSAKLTIDSRTADATKLAALEDALFGTEAAESYLPLPDEVITMMTVV